MEKIGREPSLAFWTPLETKMEDIKDGFLLEISQKSFFWGHEDVIKPFCLF